MPRPKRVQEQGATGPAKGNTLIYVDPNLIVPIATKALGSAIVNSGTLSIEAGFDWFANMAVTGGSGTSTETRLAELFPEDVFAYAYPHLSSHCMSIEQFRDGVTSGSIRPASVVSVTGVLSFPTIDLSQYAWGSPENTPSPACYSLYQYECFRGQLKSDGFEMPLHFLAGSQHAVCYANGKRVEVVGVMKWSPPYEVANVAINGEILVAALLLTTGKST